MRGSRKGKRRRRAANKYQKVVEKLKKTAPEEMVKETFTVTRYNFQLMKPVEPTENIRVMMIKKDVKVGKVKIKVKCQQVVYTYEKWVPKVVKGVKLTNRHKAA